eukprot:tig00021234_g19417.t1
MNGTGYGADLAMAAGPPDHLGRRVPFLVLGLLGAAAGHLLRAAYPSRWLVLAGLCVAGAGRRTGARARPPARRSGSSSGGLEKVRRRVPAGRSLQLLALSGRRGGGAGGGQGALSGDFAEVGVCFGAALSFILGLGPASAAPRRPLPAPRLPLSLAARRRRRRRGRRRAAAAAFALPEPAALRALAIDADAGGRRPPSAAAGECPLENSLAPLRLLARSTPLGLLLLS